LNIPCTDFGKTGRASNPVFRPDGTIFISDDKTGVIYRISRKK
jgi:glucose/arabinose dehydrogenase